MARIEKCFKGFFTSAIKPNHSHLACRLNFAQFISRYTFLNSCCRTTFVVLVNENNTISEVTFVQGLVFMPPCPPMRAPCFPIAKTSTGGLAWCWVKRCVGGLCCTPCLIGSLQDILSNSCLLYTSPSPRDMWTSRMPSSA